MYSCIRQNVVVSYNCTTEDFGYERQNLKHTETLTIVLTLCINFHNISTCNETYKPM